MGLGAEIRPGEGLARVGLRLALLILVAGIAGAVACGCREPSNCDRHTDSWRCSPAGRPERCSEGNVWRSWAYGPCSLSGGRCVVLPGVGATCLPADRDAGPVSLPPNPYAADAASAE